MTQDDCGMVQSLRTRRAELSRSLQELRDKISANSSKLQDARVEVQKLEEIMARQLGKAAALERDLASLEEPMAEEGDASDEEEALERRLQLLRKRRCARHAGAATATSQPFFTSCCPAGSFCCPWYATAIAGSPGQPSCAYSRRRG